MSEPRTFEEWCFTATTHITPSTAWEAGQEALRAALLADRPEVAELCAWHRRNLCPLFKDNGSCDPSGECSCSMRERIVSTLESQAAQLAAVTADRNMIDFALKEYEAALAAREEEVKRLREECASLRVDAVRHYAMRSQFADYGKISVSLPIAAPRYESGTTYASPEAYDAAIDKALKEGSHPATGLHKEPTR